MGYIILFGILIGFSIILSGWVRLILMVISNGLLGNNIAWLYFFLGIFFGKGFPSKITSSEYWALFASSLISTLIVQVLSARFDMKSSGNYSTVTTCASLFFVGEVLGMIYYLIFV